MLALLLGASDALDAQMPDAATLDRWWLDACTGDSPTRDHSRRSLQQHAEQAAPRGIVHLRSPEEPSGQGLAFLIADLGTPGFEALLRECVTTDSPVRALALEGALWHRSRHMDHDPDFAAKNAALGTAAVQCLDTTDETLMRQVTFGIANVNDTIRALLEQRLRAPAPLGPRAAVFLGTHRPRPPIRALFAALEDPLPSIQAAAASQLSQREDAEAATALAQMLQQATHASSAAAIDHLTMWARGPWPVELIEALAGLVAAELPAPLGETWFEDLRSRQQIVEGAATRAAAGTPESAATAPILLAALRLPHADADWIRCRIDELRIPALRGLVALGAAAPPETADLIDGLIARDPLPAPLLTALFSAQQALFPAQTPDLPTWAARYRAAIEAASATQPGKRLAHDAARTVAATFDALGRLGDTGSVPWLRDQVRLDTEARSAAAGALVRLTGDDPTTRAIVRTHLLAPPTRWAHDEVLAAALGDRGAEAAWAAVLLLDRLPAQASDESRTVVADVTRIALASAAEDRDEIRDAMVRRLRKDPRDAHAESFARSIAVIDPDHAMALHRETGFGQRLYEALLRVAPARLVPLLDSEQRGEARHTHEVLKNYGRPEPATVAAFVELLQQAELRDPDLVLETLAKIGPPPELLPLLERWLPRTLFALRAMVATGKPAVPRIAAVGLAHLRSGDLRILHALGEDGAPLIPLLLEHPEPMTREMVPPSLPFFGTPGIEALRRLQPDETDFCNTLVPVLMDNTVGDQVRLAVADELLLHPEAVGIGHYDLARTARSPALAERLLLLQGSRDPNGPGATEALLDTLASPEPKLRTFALRQLAGNPDRERIENYVHWLRDDPDPGVQRALAYFDQAARGR